VVLTAVAVAAVLLAVGTVSHVADFVRAGWTPYPWAPRWLNLYWTSLALFDTAAAVRLLAGRRPGADLAMAIMVTDLAANVYAAVGLRHADPFAEPGVLRLGVFTLVVLVVGPLMRPHLRR
jgi:hypothetical protein